jgi:hypothetical protein
MGLFATLVRLGVGGQRRDTSRRRSAWRDPAHLFNHRNCLPPLISRYRLDRAPSLTTLSFLGVPITGPCWAADRANGR